MKKYKLKTLQLDTELIEKLEKKCIEEGLVTRKSGRPVFNMIAIKAFEEYVKKSEE